MRAGTAAASVGLSVALHATLALRIGQRRLELPKLSPPVDIEMTTMHAASPVRPFVAPPKRRVHALVRPVMTSNDALEQQREPDRLAPQDPRTASTSPPVDLFDARVLRGVVGAPPIDPGGHLRRTGDAADTDRVGEERENVGHRVRDFVDGEAARERAASGRIAPQWRDIERKLSQSFRPPVALVRQEGRVKAFAHQLLRSWLDGPPHVGPAPRRLDTSVQTFQGVPEGLNLRSLPVEQALAVQARWGEAATSLVVDIEVTVDEDGRIVESRVAFPSGRRAFDRFALAAVEDAVRNAGAPAEKRTVRTRWRVEGSVAVAPPTGVGLRFDETGNTNPGAKGIRKYLAGTYPMQESVQTHVSLIGVEPR